MKKCMLLIALAIFLSTVAKAQETLKINTTKSQVKWVSDYTFYFDGGHHGTVAFKEGHFIKTNDKITGGSFIIDMNTIANVDGGYNEGLVNHLKNEDFFDVEKYPTSKLVITEVYYNNKNQITVKANLTIKGITKPIQFKADLDYEKQQLYTRFKIDRTLWGVTYNNRLKNDAISDAIKFEVTIRL